MGGQFDGKVALVTGAASGIGKAMALGLAREGASVVVSDVAVPGGEETVDLIQGEGGRAVFVKADVSQADDVEALIAATLETYGRLDCALNNAGISGTPKTPITKCTVENWDNVMAINLRGLFLCLKQEIPVMLEQGGGVIVNTASTMGVVAHEDCPAYVASKHGVVGLTKSAALAYVRQGIRVNAVCPGHTDTAIFDFVKREAPEVLDGLQEAIPPGRLARPEEVAAAAIWLCSDAASYCNGHALMVDGCYTVR